jgi:O-6-methylguanine DNA methyltransferase
MTQPHDRAASVRSLDLSEPVSAGDPSLSRVEAALRDLREPAPPALVGGSLVAVGLADAYALFDAPIGRIAVAWNGRGVTMVDLADDLAAFETRHAELVGRPLVPGARMPDRLRRAVERRLAGDRRSSIPLDLRGRAEFERSVWLKALEIPRGEVRPYGWIAAEIGRPRAVRAVGSALGRNPVPLLVPCHRVVRTDGTIGQYSLGGPAIKRRVLAAEGVDLGRLERLASSGVRFVGSDTTHIVCHPTCHHARRITPQHEVPFHSLGDAERAGYRACRDCRPVAIAA